MKKCYLTTCFFVIAMLSGCASQPETTVPKRSYVVTENGTPVYRYDQDRYEHLFDRSPVLWTGMPEKKRTRAQDSRLEVLSTSDLVQIRPQEADQAKEALNVLTKDARYYIVQFVVKSELDYPDLVSFFDNHVLLLAKNMGHNTTKWLRAGYQLSPEDKNHILIEAVR